MIDPAALMQLAIDKCRHGIAAGQSPFGCAIALGDQVVAVAHNTVLATLDVTAHAEVNALRAACQRQFDIHLPGAIVATTCEPCPMCTAALHWARVERVYYGATIDDAKAAGFNEMQVPAAEIARLGGSSIQLSPGVLADECRQLFAAWKQTANPRTY
ncbi:MAG TPA: nucleoside deaminase [Pirellulales bacterium]|nr:nucleoside deaminase [Pirellulales bacterium]